MSAITLTASLLSHARLSRGYELERFQISRIRDPLEMAVYRIPRGWSERLGDVDGASPPAPIEDAPVADACYLDSPNAIGESGRRLFHAAFTGPGMAPAVARAPAETPPPDVVATAVDAVQQAPARLVPPPPPRAANASAAVAVLRTSTEWAPTHDVRVVPPPPPRTRYAPPPPPGPVVGAPPPPPRAAAVAPPPAPPRGDGVTPLLSNTTVPASAVEPAFGRFGAPPPGPLVGAPPPPPRATSAASRSSTAGVAPPPAPPRRDTARLAGKPPTSSSLVDALAQLSLLKTQGVLTDEEFEAAKAKVLAGK